jgi:hypothetical protein
MKKRIIGYLLSAASVYLTITYFTNLFLSMIKNFGLNVI